MKSCEILITHLSIQSPFTDYCTAVVRVWNRLIPCLCAFLWELSDPAASGVLWFSHSLGHWWKWGLLILNSPFQNWFPHWPVKLLVSNQEPLSSVVWQRYNVLITNFSKRNETKINFSRPSENQKHYLQMHCSSKVWGQSFLKDNITELIFSKDVTNWKVTVKAFIMWQISVTFQINAVFPF